MANSKKSFLSHFLAIGTGTIISMFLSLISTPIITRVVDPDEYGQLSIFTMYTDILMMVLCMGLDQALVRFFYDKEELSYKRSLLKLCFLVPLISAVIVSCIVLLLSFLGFVKFEFEPLVMTLLCLNVLVCIADRIAMLLLRVTYQSKKFAISNILKKVVYIIVSISLVFCVRSNYFVLLCIATICSFLAPAIYSITQTKEMWSFKNSEKYYDKKSLFKYSVPLIFSMGITTLFQAIDKISLNKYCTYNEVGIYSSAVMLVAVFAIIQSTFNSLWGPMQVEHYVKHPEDKTYIQRANQMITVIMFGLGICLILVKDLFALLLGEKFREAAYILPFLIFNPIMYTISETTCAGIGYSQKSYLSIIVALGACITNIIGNSILVPVLECKGAAISTGVSYFVFWALRTVLSNCFYKVNYKIPRFLLLTVLTGIYAWYNTFFDFSVISVVMWAVVLVCIILLYKNAIFDILNMIKTFFRRKQND